MSKEIIEMSCYIGLFYCVDNKFQISLIAWLIQIIIKASAVISGIVGH